MTGSPYFVTYASVSQQPRAYLRVNNDKVWIDERNYYGSPIMHCDDKLDVWVELKTDPHDTPKSMIVPLAMASDARVSICLRIVSS